MNDATTNDDVWARLAVALAARLDEIAEKLSTPSRKATRADALRVMITTGLELLALNAPAARLPEEH